MKYKNILEEELKIKVRDDFFSNYNSSIIGKVDFCITLKYNDGSSSLPFGEGWGGASLLWAEAKTGNYDIFTMFAQLILTIGKARTFDKYLPPTFLGAFDATKIVFIPYNAVVDIFSLNDFNWNVTPSNHETKEFLLIKDRIEKSLDQDYYLYDYIKDEAELHFFIKNNLAKATESGKILIDKNNFVPIYLRWLDQIKPHIEFNWEQGKKLNIHDNEFYLADLFVDDKGTSNIEDDTPVKEDIFVVFRNSHYEITKENLKSLFNASVEIKDKKAYEQFWKKYKRPPLSQMHDYIINRKDLLVPQDIRERKGAFFTPKIWVELSQQYIAKTIGNDWQEEYYVWDCAAGTGNLLAGLTNKYNLWASTLDQSDVNAMHDRIANGANLLKAHCFQFDFLNDDFSNLPQKLQDIINDPQKRKKLVVYINPPYAEADNRKGEGRVGVALSKIKTKYEEQMGYTKRELYIQFKTRIYFEINGCILAEFSTLKSLQAPKFVEFRNYIKAKLEKCFIIPANTFDNVTGSFPIGFKIWNTNKINDFKSISANVYNENGIKQSSKKLYSYDNEKLINEWVKTFRYSKLESIATIIGVGSDFQNQRLVRIDKPHMKVPASNHNWQITSENLIKSSIYYTVRKIIPATWLNDRDQFLFPNKKWEKDLEFRNDCLTYTLFSSNRIQSKDGINHWIPFTEKELNARTKFDSNFMTQFLFGKIEKNNPKNDNLFIVSEPAPHYESPLRFSDKAAAVFDAGRALWQYYHTKPAADVNGSLYDIREFFQGRNDSGKMNNKSQDETYNNLINQLRKSLKILANKIEPKVYEYEFLKE